MTLNLTAVSIDNKKHKMKHQIRTAHIRMLGYTFIPPLQSGKLQQLKFHVAAGEILGPISANKIPNLNIVD